MLPSGARARQLSVRTLLLGMMLALADGRPAHLTRVHQALTGLPEDEQRRLGVLADWKDGPHLLTYRQAEYTFGLIAGRARQGRAGRAAVAGAAARLRRPARSLIPEEFKDASSSLAVDWSDLESFSRPPPHGTSDCADPEASWGHRRNNLLHDEDELFFGYYLSAATMVPDEQGPPVPELARRMTVSSCRHDPVPAFTPVLTAMPGARHPARRRAGRLRLLPPRSRRTGHPRSAPPARSSSRTCTRTTAAPRAPTRARSSPTAASTARAAPRTLLELGPLARAATPAAGRRARREDRRGRPLQARPPHRATTPTATTASPAPPPRARSAARCAPRR